MVVHKVKCVTVNGMQKQANVFHTHIDRRGKAMAGAMAILSFSGYTTPALEWAMAA